MSENARTIRLSRAHYPVTVLGPGRRIGIWVQGCAIGCRGCIARDTWDAGAGRVETVEALLGWVRAVAAQGFDGITISGGEPFEQPEALLSLLRELVDWRAKAGRDFDVLCYSGLPYRRLKAAHGDILELLDAIIPERFIRARPLGATWQGSNNQPLITLSRRGKERYKPFIDGLMTVSKALQFTVDENAIWFIGVPARGDMERLEALARAQQLQLENASWSAKSNIAPTATSPMKTGSI